MSAFVKAAASALAEVPAVNGVIDEQEIIYRCASSTSCYCCCGSSTVSEATALQLASAAASDQRVLLGGAVQRCSCYSCISAAASLLQWRGGTTRGTDNGLGALGTQLLVWLRPSCLVLCRDYTDISIAVATPKGLVVPVLRSVDKLSFAEVEKVCVHACVSCCSWGVAAWVGLGAGGVWGGGGGSCRVGKHRFVQVETACGCWQGSLRCSVSVW
jgi:hypothetical protein